MFSTEQKTQLTAKLDGKQVKHRAQAGMQLSYIEGWWAIAEANRIFGHDGWSRETIMLKCVWEGKRTSRAGKELATASYIAQVRVKVGEIVREGTGSGSGMGSDPGEAHESAAKEAETDAMKRALMTFGNPFGLALYDKEQTDVDNGPKKNGNGKDLGLDQETRDEAWQTWARGDKAKEWFAVQKDILGKVNTAEEVMNWRKFNAKYVLALQDFAPERFAKIEKIASDASDRVTARS